MLALYKSAAKFIIAGQRMCGDSHANLASSQAARIKHFEHNLPSQGKNVEDSEAVMTALAEDTPAFTAEQRKRTLHPHLIQRLKPNEKRNTSGNTHGNTRITERIGARGPSTETVRADQPHT